MRTYGFSVARGLTLLCLPAETDPLAVAALLAEAPVRETPVALCAAVGAPDGALLLNLVGRFPPHLEALLPPGAVCERAVETVTFHGPHFGDRYGIAAATLDCLERGAVPLLAASFSGASVCLVVPTDWADRTVAALGGAFVGPTPTPEGDGAGPIGRGALP